MKHRIKIRTGLMCLMQTGSVFTTFRYSLIRQKQWIYCVGGYICCIPCLISDPVVISAYSLWGLLQVRLETKETEPVCKHDNKIKEKL